MNLFTLDNNKVRISPEALTIKEFKDIWEKDSTKGKDYAAEELAFVYFMSDFKSPYMSYAAEARQDRITRDVITKKGWVPGDYVKIAIEKYKELQETPSMALLKDAETALEKIRYYFRNVDITQDENGNITKTLIANVERLGGVIKGLSVLRESVDKEISESKRVRGQGVVGLRELPRKK